MKYTLGLILIFLFTSASAQNINWEKANDWKMYKITGDKGLRYSIDSVIKFPFIEMSDDSVFGYVKYAELLPKEKNYLWMGAYYSTCVIENKLHKINISYHGGFFYDENTKRYYQLPMNLRNQWIDWLITLKHRANEKQR